MNKCLKITFSVSKIPAGFLRTFIQKYARKLEIEGTAQVTEEDFVTILACGTGESIDELLDIIHKGTKEYIPENIAVEPFLKKKDYRGVFRVIE